MQVVRTVAETRQLVGAWRQGGERISLVPTMGALHDGHMSLVRQASDLAERRAVSIFVNPTQFAPNEDFTTYPRTEERDLAMQNAPATPQQPAPPRPSFFSSAAARGSAASSFFSFLSPRRGEWRRRETTAP